MEQHFFQSDLSLSVPLRSVTLNTKSPENTDEILGLRVFSPLPSLLSPLPYYLLPLSLLISPHC